jgi:hypothetical protein
MIRIDDKTMALQTASQWFHVRYAFTTEDYY